MSYETATAFLCGLALGLFVSAVDLGCAAKAIVWLAGEVDDK